MLAFANANTYFEERNACLIGLSVDSNPSHLAWIYDIYLKTGIIIPFPIIADKNGVIARKYGMIPSNISKTETVRNVYIINPEGIIKLIFIQLMIQKLVLLILFIVQMLLQVQIHIQLCLLLTQVKNLTRKTLN